MANKRKNKSGNKRNKEHKNQNPDTKREIKEQRCKNSKQSKEEILRIKNEKNISECKSISSNNTSKRMDLTQNGFFGKKYVVAIKVAKRKSMKKGCIKNNILEKRKVKDSRHKNPKNITSAETMLSLQSPIIVSNELQNSIEKVMKKDILVVKGINYDCLKYFPIQYVTVGNLSCHGTLFGNKTLNSSPLCDVIFENMAREDRFIIYSNEICLAYNLVLNNKSANSWQENMYFTLDCVKCNSSTFICQSIDALFSFKEPNHKILCDIYKSQQNYISLIYEGCFFPVLKVKNCNRCSLNFDKYTDETNASLVSLDVTETSCLMSDRLQSIENTSSKSDTYIVNIKVCDKTSCLNAFITDNSFLPTNICIKSETYKEENVGNLSLNNCSSDVNSLKESSNTFYPLNYCLLKEPIEDSSQFCKECYNNLLPKVNSEIGTCENLSYPIHENLILPQVVNKKAIENVQTGAMLNIEKNKALGVFPSDCIKECLFTEESLKQLTNFGYPFYIDQNSVCDAKLNDNYVYDANSYSNCQVDLSSSFLNNHILDNTNYYIYPESNKHSSNSIFDHLPKDIKHSKCHDGSTFNSEDGQNSNTSALLRNVDAFPYPSSHLDLKFNNTNIYSIDSVNSSCKPEKRKYVDNYYLREIGSYCSTRHCPSIILETESICKEASTLGENIQNIDASSVVNKETSSVNENYVPQIKNLCKEDNKSLTNNCKCMKVQSDPYQISDIKSNRIANQRPEHLDVYQTFELTSSTDGQIPSHTKVREKTFVRGSELIPENLHEDYQSVFQSKCCNSFNPNSFTEISWETPNLYGNFQSENGYRNKFYRKFHCKDCRPEYGTNNFNKYPQNISRISDLSRLPIENKYAFRQYARNRYNSTENCYYFNRKYQYQNFRDKEKFGWITQPNNSRYQNNFVCNCNGSNDSFFGTCENDFSKIYKGREQNFNSHRKSSKSNFSYNESIYKNASYTKPYKSYRGMDFSYANNNTKRWRGVNDNPQERFFNAAVAKS